MNEVSKLSNRKNILKKLVFPGILALLLVAIVSMPNIMAPAGSFQTTFMGFRSNEGGSGALSTHWNTGNLGNTWSEGEWVPYQAILENVQVDYPGLAGMPNIEISYDFDNKGNRFVDLIKSIQVGTTQLTDMQGWPQSDGTPYPMNTRAELEIAQKSEGENLWIDYQFLNLPYNQLHRALDGSIGTPTDEWRKIVITPQNLIDLGYQYNDTIIIYFLLHESRTFIWDNSLQAGYDTSPTDDWGGYIYGVEPFSSDQRLGSGYVPGSSGHAQLEISGAKTVPIPIPETLPGFISGYKWFDSNRDGVKDISEPFLSGWNITVNGTVEGINFKTSTLTDSTGYYSFPSLTSGTIWRIAEDQQRQVPVEDGYTQMDNNLPRRNIRNRSSRPNNIPHNRQHNRSRLFENNQKLDSTRRL
jgi:hypothetical protein